MVPSRRPKISTGRNRLHPGAQQANFAGYVLWSGWMLALAVTFRSR